MFLQKKITQLEMHAQVMVKNVGDAFMGHILHSTSQQMMTMISMCQISLTGWRVSTRVS